jgi:hypothetical protein
MRRSWKLMFLVRTNLDNAIRQTEGTKSHRRFHLSNSPKTARLGGEETETDLLKKEGDLKPREIVS